MTREMVQEHINRHKARMGTWKALADAKGLNLKQLQMVASGNRPPDEATLSAFGIVKSVREIYKFAVAK